MDVPVEKKGNNNLKGIDLNSERENSTQKFTGKNSRFEMRVPKLWHKLRLLDAPSKSKPPTKKSKK